MPRRDLTEAYRNEYFFLFDRPDTSVATSRGCPFRCSFCSVHEFYRGAINQMPPRASPGRGGHSLHRSHHVRRRQFSDEPRSGDRDCRYDQGRGHPEAILHGVPHGFHRPTSGARGRSGWISGCTPSSWGWRAEVDKMLKSVKKSCTIDTNNRAIKILQDHGVIIWGAFLVDPDWTADDFQRLRDYVREKQITHTQFTILTPLPGTQLYRDRYARAADPRLLLLRHPARRPADPPAARGVLPAFRQSLPPDRHRAVLRPGAVGKDDHRGLPAGQGDAGRRWPIGSGTSKRTRSWRRVAEEFVPARQSLAVYPRWKDLLDNCHDVRPKIAGAATGTRVTIRWTCGYRRRSWTTLRIRSRIC